MGSSRWKTTRSFLTSRAHRTTRQPNSRSPGTIRIWPSSGRSVAAGRSSPLATLTTPAFRRLQQTPTGLGKSRQRNRIEGVWHSMIRATKLWCIGCAPGKERSSAYSWIAINAAFQISSALPFETRRKRRTCHRKRFFARTRTSARSIRSSGSSRHGFIRSRETSFERISPSRCVLRNCKSWARTKRWKARCRTFPRKPIPRGACFVKRPSANFARHSPSCPKGREPSWRCVTSTIWSIRRLRVRWDYRSAT